MVVLALACFLVAVGFGVVAVRFRSRAEDLEHALDTTLIERDALDAGLVDARQEEAAARTERDEALARVQRSRRDAAEVASRLRDETGAREAADAATQAALDRCAELEHRLEASSVGGVLWDLALVRAEQTWHTSLSIGLDDRSPLADADDPLRAAAEIAVAAASEEAGADIELRWDVATPSPPPNPDEAVQVLAVVESAVGAVAKSARSTVIAVTITPSTIDIGVDAVDEEGAPLVVALPDALQVRPGLAQVTRQGAGST